MTRRRKEPDPRDILRFIAEYESLTLTCDEFPSVSEKRLREMLRAYAAPPESGARRTQVKREKERVAARVAPKVELYTDGASRGNPGPAAAGWVITDGEGDVLRKGNVFLGRRTNNEAEYEAVIHGLNAVRDLGAKTVSLRCDSQLLVKQINGQNRIKNARLQQLHEVARELMGTFRRFDARHIQRDKNTAADAEAKRALDEADSQGAA